MFANACPGTIAHASCLIYITSMTQSRWLGTIVLASLALVSVLTSVSVAARSQPVLIKVIPTADSRLSTARATPSAVEWLMSGDFMTRLRWRHWGAIRTDAVGVYNLNLCNPCAAGHIQHAPGRVTLSTIRSCRGVRLYTVARATYFVRGRWHLASGLGQPTNPCSG